MRSNGRQDHFLLSKGHSVEGYWAILADLGYFPKADLRTFSQAGSPLIGHPNNKVPGVEVCTGALGHGLPRGRGHGAGGQAHRHGRQRLRRHGRRRTGRGQHLGSGHGRRELPSGQSLRGRGPQRPADQRPPPKRSWRWTTWPPSGAHSAGDVVEADGNDMQALLDYYHGSHPTGMPHLLLAHTVKGKGLPLRKTAPSGTTMCPVKNSSSRPMRRWA